MTNLYDVVAYFIVTTFALGLVVLSVTGDEQDRKAFRDLATVVVSLFIGTLTERAGSERRRDQTDYERRLLEAPPPKLRGYDGPTEESTDDEGESPPSRPPTPGPYEPRGNRPPRY